MATNENLPPNVIRQLAKELKNLDETPPEGIKVVVNDDNFSTIFADIEGPAGTPYENGLFRMKLLLSHDFPHSPPMGYFLTKIFHPNIATNGEICVNTLKKDWNPNLGLRHVLIVVRCLLIEPFPESALNEHAGKLLLENYEEYARRARLYTSIHATKPKPKFKTGAISESTTALNVDPMKTVPGTAIVPSTCPTPSSTTSKGGQDPDASKCPVDNAALVLKEVPEANVDVSTISRKELSAANVDVLAMPRKDVSAVAKAQVDKKKIDARKKSLKRL